MAPIITISRELLAFWPSLGSLCEISDSLERSSSERKNVRNLNVFSTCTVREASGGPRLCPGRSPGPEIIPTGAEIIQVYDDFG